MKSSVMTLANRLHYKRGMSRRQALTVAWAMVKAGHVTSPVAGVQFGNRQEALHRLAGYSIDAVRITLERENNEHDSNAVAILVSVNGSTAYKLGYLPKETAAVWSALVEKGKAAARLEKVVGGHGFTYGARVALEVAA
mgnify:CR=1 FL=1